MFFIVVLLSLFAPPEEDPRLIMEAMDRMSAKELWPGFEPAGYPVAIYTGTETFLFRHPHPPEGFEEGEGVARFSGRHPAVVANSSTEIGGVETATLLLDGSGSQSLEALAAIALHELFHVYQGERHPRWSADEAALFSYPVEDEEGFRNRLLEQRALVRALEAKDRAQCVPWAKKALAIRKDRLAKLDGEHKAYERGTELKEGTAHYVEYLALGKASDCEACRIDYSPAKIRLRCYVTGRALAALLDRFDEHWKEELDSSLDERLSRALSGYEAEPAVFLEEEVRLVEKTARRSLANLQAEKEVLRKKVLSPEAWKVRVQVFEGADLLALKGFDPMNVLKLSDKEVLHTRMFRVGSPDGQIEMMSRLDAISFSAGSHPLFNGFRWVVYSGFKNEPEVVQEGDDRVVIKVEGFDLELSGAKVIRKEKEILVLIGSPP